MWMIPGRCAFFFFDFGDSVFFGDAGFSGFGIVFFRLRFL